MAVIHLNNKESLATDPSSEFTMVNVGGIFTFHSDDPFEKETTFK